MGKNQHVVPHGGDWAVKGEGNKRATSVHGTKKEAEDAARKITQKEGTELLIHGLGGEIQRRDSHGKDPKRSKG